MECVHCKTKNDLTAFSVRHGGTFCSCCLSNAGTIKRIGESTLYTLQFICITPIEKLYSFTVKEEVLQELSSLIEDYQKEYVEYKLKSLDMLELLEDGKMIL